MNDENSPPRAAGPIETRPAWRSFFATKRVLVIVAVLLALALLAWLLTPTATKTPAGGRFAAGGPMPVVVASAHAGDMPITLIGLGTVTPLATARVPRQ